MKLDCIHHVAIIVSNYQAALEFYRDKLGLPLKRDVDRPAQGDRILTLGLDQGELEIFVKPDAPLRPTDPEARGLRHLAFRVESVEETAASLVRLGIPCDPIRMDPYTQKPMTFFYDPDGLPLELHE